MAKVISFLLNTLFTGRALIQLDETVSTNAFAWELLKGAPAEGTVVLANAQSGGKGQAGNRWESAPGENLTFSLILFPTFLTGESLFYLSKLACLAVWETVSALLPEHKLKIKWPNDLVSDRGKMAGILIENQLEGKRVKSSVIGIGLNVNQLTFPPMEGLPAVSLRMLSGKELDLRIIFEDLCLRLEQGYLLLRSGKRDQLDAAYFRELFGYGQEVRFNYRGKVESGRIEGVETSGRLIVRMGNQINRFDIKEISLRMPGT
jgi:BirA family biotin operon repressor/biotin-[acetyl-CoA-carboxylase] ligase